MGAAVLAVGRVLVHADRATGEGEGTVEATGTGRFEDGGDVAASVVDREQGAISVGLVDVEYSVFGEREAGAAGRSQGDEGIAVHVQVFVDFLAGFEATAVRVEDPVVQDWSCLGGAPRHCNSGGARQFLHEFHIIKSSDKVYRLGKHTLHLANPVPAYQNI